MLLGMLYRLQIYHIWNNSLYGGPWAEDWCLEVGPPDRASNRKGVSCKVAWLRALAWEVRLKLAVPHLTSCSCQSFLIRLWDFWSHAVEVTEIRFDLRGCSDLRGCEKELYFPTSVGGVG